MLKQHIFPDHEAVSRFAADWLADELLRKPESLLCLATGKTPMRTYEVLAQRRAIEPRLFDKMRIINLDEWAGLSPDDPATCGRHLRDALVDPLDLADRYVSFDSQPADPEADCARVATWLAQNGPIDICVLGLGVNGHLGFNEPADFLQPHAHVVRLSESSLSHAMIGQCSARPARGLTLGMDDLMQSKKVLFLVTGRTKRHILREILSGRITTIVPASLLHLHPNAQLLCDEAAVGG
jgi:galactosamine-6-phosphate isomerase